MRLVADVGGTNTRLALCQAGEILTATQKSFANADWDSMYAVINAFLAGPLTEQPTEMVIAVAGPVRGDQALLTNLNWTIESGRLVREMGCAQVQLLND